MRAALGRRPSVIAAMRAAAPDMWMYCDPDNHDLKPALAAHLGVGYGNVVVGEGIDGLLNLVVRMMISEGMPVVTSLGAYPTFNFHVAGVGGRLVAVPYENDRESLDGLLAAVRRENAPLVYLSNPDNPMGTWWEAAEISRFIEALPETTDAGARRGLWRARPAFRAAAARRFAPERASHAHLLQGLWACRHTLRLCGRRGELHPRLREDPQPLRRQPHGAGRRRSRARRPGLACRGEAEGRGRPRADRKTSRATTGCRRSRRPPTSSPSTAAPTAPSR